MEQEYKWNADEALQERVLTWALAHGGDAVQPVEMDAAYYDTPDHALSAEKTALRLRRENGETVCCLKLRGAEAVAGGLHAHEEYECPADTLADGLCHLPEAGAPRVLCERLAALPLAETCRIAFLRRAVLLRYDGGEAELALDLGTLSANGKNAPLCEIELEYKSGSEAAFHTVGQSLAAEFGLEGQPLSKLARARAL